MFHIKIDEKLTR